MYCGSGAAGGAYTSPPGPYGPGPAPGPYGGGYDDCEGDDCVKMVTTYKKVTTPCVRNVTEVKQIRVPRDETYVVSRKVPYTDYEVRTTQVPDVRYKKITCCKKQKKCVKVPVGGKRGCKMVPYTEMIPQTRMVPVTRYRPVTKQKMVTVDKPVRVNKIVTEMEPYQDTQTVRYQIPTTKYRTEMQTRTKTVMDKRTTMECRPVTRIVTTRVPEVTLVPKPPAPCPPPQDGGYGPVPPGAGFAMPGTLVGVDANRDGMISRPEMGFIPRY